MTTHHDRSPASLARVLLKNRRKCYLDTHPEYFDDPALELADPLAYDRLIRRFQSTSEREAEGKKKGYSGILEADLWRSEAKVEALKNPEYGAEMRYRRDEKGEIIAEEKDEVPPTKAEGRERWRKEMELRFVRGEDAEFDYKAVDEKEEYDDKRTIEREKEEAWFGEEEPQWADTVKEKELRGQTGILDY